MDRNAVAVFTKKLSGKITFHRNLQTKIKIDLTGFSPRVNVIDLYVHTTGKLLEKNSLYDGWQPVQNSDRKNLVCPEIAVTNRKIQIAFTDNFPLEFFIGRVIILYDRTTSKYLSCAPIGISGTDFI